MIQAAIKANFSQMAINSLMVKPVIKKQLDKMNLDYVAVVLAQTGQYAIADLMDDENNKRLIFLHACKEIAKHADFVN
jgi:hypothetical protein